MTDPDARVVDGESIRRRLGAVRARTEAVEAALLAVTYAASLEEAKTVAYAMRFEPHAVAAIAGPRAELSYLVARRAALEAELVALGPVESAPVITTHFTAGPLPRINYRSSK